MKRRYRPRCYDLQRFIRILWWVVGAVGATRVHVPFLVDYVMEPFDDAVVVVVDEAVPTTPPRFVIEGGTLVRSTTTPDGSSHHEIVCDADTIATTRTISIRPAAIAPTSADRLVVHNVGGASHVSFWYQYRSSTATASSSSSSSAQRSGSPRPGLTLWDSDFVCESSLCREGTREAWTTFDNTAATTTTTTTTAGRISTTTPSTNEWLEFIVDLSQMMILTPPDDDTSHRGVNNNGELDLDRIVDWSIRFVFPDEDDDTVPPCHGGAGGGSILLRQLSFHGGPNLVAAALSTRSWTEASHHNVIDRLIHLSNDSESFTDQSLHGPMGSFDIDYLAEQTENWGGFIQYRHLAPGRAYYNLSRAEEIRFDYIIQKPAHPHGRAHLRLMLFDGEGCRGGGGSDDCEQDSMLNTEVYYSFHYILQDTSQDRRSVAIALQGDQYSNSSFWRTGWIGVEHNNVLDKGYIKGFAFEISLNSQGSIGSTVTGALVVTNVTVAPVHTYVTPIKQGIVHEPSLRFTNLAQSDFQRLEFVNLEKCEQECLAHSSSCNFAISTDYGKDCYIGTSVTLQNVALSNTTFALESTMAFWKDTIESRGEACQKCRCDPVAGLIDCTGLDLVFPPKALTNWTWKPLKLDLRDNSRMTIIGEGCLRGYETLEYIYFPANLTYLAPSNMDHMPYLREVEYEATDIDVATNMVTTTGELFVDKCCAKAQRGNFAPLHFCDLKVDVPGEDTIFEEFVQYFSLEQLDIIDQGSSFLGEAAENAQNCAAICAIRADCYYFTFDGRFGASTNICYHYKSISSRHENCCNPGDYQDENQTIPGWISGRVPRTRCIEDNARVILTSEPKLALEASNGYRASYSIRLGANPRRGAVWVKPAILSTNGLDVAFDPMEVALYDMNPATFSVYLSRLPSDGTDDQVVVIANKVDACDAAFATTSSCRSEEELQVFVSFVSDQGEHRATFIGLLVAVCTMIFSGVVATLWYTNRKLQQANALWKIPPSQVVFAEPPEYLGRGKFGHVVKASFCGTPVAIKRVLPPIDVDDDMVVLAYGISAFPPVKHEESVSINCDNVDSESPLQLCDARKEYWWNALQPVTTDRKALRSKFVADIQRLSQVRHSCVVTIMGAIDYIDPLLVLEYMDHGSLRDVLSNETFALNGELVLPILQDITQGLRFLHSISPQIVHGDLKAANCLVDKRFHVKLSGFGLGHVRNVGAMGSPLWMAPELLRGESTNTPQSDVFSLGIFLYEIYSRKELYEGQDILFICEQVSDPIVKMRPPYAQISPSKMSLLVEHCLKHDPHDRPTASCIDEQLQIWEVQDVEPLANMFSVQPNKRHTCENSVLYDIFPQHVADALKEGRPVETEDHELVTIFFSDIVNYTTYSQSLEPRKVANLLDRLYNAFDELSDLHGVRKVETIGDSWMGVTNLSGTQPMDHCARVARFSFDALQVAARTLIDECHPELGYVVIRVGFHSGPVVADVVGSRNPRYCLFGDTVNTASRMESHSKPGLAHCSEVSALLIQEQDPAIDIISRGTIDIKGKGPMATYFVQPKSKTATSETASGGETTTATTTVLPEVNNPSQGETRLRI